MKITIEIDCFDDDEVLTHLSVIRKELKKELKARENESTLNFEFSDSNCYGDHIVIVTD